MIGSFGCLRASCFQVLHWIYPFGSGCLFSCVLSIDSILYSARLVRMRCHVVFLFCLSSCLFCFRLCYLRQSLTTALALAVLELIV